MTRGLRLLPAAGSALMAPIASAGHFQKPGGVCARTPATPAEPVDP
jgi:hypothetical protein